MSEKQDYWKYDGRWYWFDNGCLFSTPLTQIEKSNDVIEEGFLKAKEFSISKMRKSTARTIASYKTGIVVRNIMLIAALITFPVGFIISSEKMFLLLALSFFITSLIGVITASYIREEIPKKKYKFLAHSREIEVVHLEHFLFDYGDFPEYAEDLIKDKERNRLLNYVGDEIIWVLDWLESDGVKGTVMGEKSKNSFMEILKLGSNAQIRNTAIEWNACETFVIEHLAHRIKTTKLNIENKSIEDSFLEEEIHELAQPAQPYSPPDKVLEDSEKDDSISTSIHKPNQSKGTTPVNLPETSRKIVAKVKAEIGRLRSDIIWVIDNPAFFDDYSFVSQKLFEELAEWDDLEYSTEKPSASTLSETSNKIQELFETAKSDAERLGMDYLHGATKSKVMKASKLVHKAQSTDSTAEHDSLMGKAAELLSGIMDTILPKQAAVALEAYSPKQLTDEKVKTASLLKIDEMIEEEVS